MVLGLSTQQGAAPHFPDDAPDEFPRGFLLSVKPVAVPRSFVRGPAAVPNLYIDPLLDVEVATGLRNSFVAVLGLCVPTSADVPAGGVAAQLLDALRRSETQFYAVLAELAGRYAVIFRRSRSAGIKIVSDATAMRSLFYAHTAGVIGSHAYLVARASKSDLKQRRLVTQYGYPGNFTPYPGVRMLTANLVYNLSNHQVARYWPKAQIPKREVKEAAAEVLERATNVLRHATAGGRPHRLALTAGLDSRTLLAAVINAGLAPETYTYGVKDNTQLDRVFSADLAKQVGLSHEEVADNTATADELAALRIAHYAAHHPGAAVALREWYGDLKALALTANLLEIGRTFYVRSYSKPELCPDTAAGMAQLHLGAMSGPVRKDKASRPEENWLGYSQERFAYWMKESQFNSVRHIMDPFDQFYWEHRMSAWHGAAMLERDFYAEALIPFNCRAVFEAMLGLSLEERQAGAIQYELIRQVDPALLDLPINPTVWPPTE